MKNIEKTKFEIDSIDFSNLNETDSNNLKIKLLKYNDDELKELLLYIMYYKLSININMDSDTNLKILFDNKRIMNILETRRNENQKEMDSIEKNTPNFKELLCFVLGYKRSELTEENMINIIENNFGDKSKIILTAMRLSFKYGKCSNE